MRIVHEAGTRSPGISRLLTELRREAIVANPRKLRGSLVRVSLTAQYSTPCDGRKLTTPVGYRTRS